jgi:tRNA threonylcarbamoyladenosine biosynthesis protein TsaE
MTGCKIQFSTQTLAETQQLGKQVGTHVQPGSVLTLKGDLGSGKTAFVQGIAKGLEVPGDYYITSPTFTLINEYPGRCRLFHMDLYRITGAEELEDIGIEDILCGDGVVAIEWAEKLPDEMIAGHLLIQISITDDQSRQICMIPHGLKAENLIKKLETI